MYCSFFFLLSLLYWIWSGAHMHACGILLFISSNYCISKVCTWCDKPLYYVLLTAVMVTFYILLLASRATISIYISAFHFCDSGSLPTPCRFGCAWDQGCSWNLLLQVCKPLCYPAIKENCHISTCNHFLFLAAADDRITRKEAWVCCNVDILFHKY